MCALLVTGLVLRREFTLNSRAQPNPEEDSYVTGWREYATAGHRMGPSNPTVTLVEFSDFQCPACRDLSNSLQRLRAKHPRDVAVVFRHYPLPMHASANDAARASECAARQGRFEAYHDALFAAQEAVGKAPWSSFARTAAVRDLSAFDVCVRDPASGPAVARDILDGQHLRVTATPTILVNGARLNGTPGTDALEERIERELRLARSTTN
jgi:protein-disulfide isomerase